MTFRLGETYMTDLKALQKELAVAVKENGAARRTIQSTHRLGSIPTRPAKFNRGRRRLAWRVPGAPRFPVARANPIRAPAQPWEASAEPAG